VAASPYDGPVLSEQQLGFLREIDSPTIANAIEGFNVRDRVDGFIGGNVRCLFPELPTLVGHALTVTVTNRPGPILGRQGFWAMWEALEAMPHPAVLVMQDMSGLPHRVAYCGEVMATYATRLGAVGLITDGGVRDLNEVRTLGFHYFAPFSVVSHANWGVLEVGVPVTIDGQVIRTGDVLHGDANGVVVVPSEILDRLPSEIEQIRTRERQAMEFVKSEGFTLAVAKEKAGYR
jgi:regulator of RNase E activity RraA